MALSDDQQRIEAIGEQLRAKIASKFTASTFFAGFALTVLSGQVFALWQSTSLPALFPAAVGVLLAAVMLFVEAVLRFDELTMPKALWDVPDVQRQRGQVFSSLLTDYELTILYERMVFLWYRLAVVAMFVTAAAVLLMLVPIGIGDPGRAQAQSIVWAVVGLIAGAIYCSVIRAEMKRKIPELFTRVD